MKKPLILPAFFFGDIWYYAILLRREHVVIDLHERYIKQTQRNHTRIFGPNGIQKLTIPVNFSNSNKTTTNEVLLDLSKNEARGHLQSITTAYGSAPFYSSFMPLIRSVFDGSHRTLGDLHRSAVRICCDILEIERVVYSDEYVSTEDDIHDFRNAKVMMGDLHPFQEYSQVFAPKHGFHANLSIIDLIFNEGRWARNYLKTISLPSL